MASIYVTTLSIGNSCVPRRAPQKNTPKKSVKKHAFTTEHIGD